MTTHPTPPAAPALPSPAAETPVPAWARPKPPALPTEPRAYHQFLRTPRARWWKGLLAIVCLVASFGLLSVGLTFAGVGIDIATGRSTVDQLTAGQFAITPMLFLMNNLALAGMVPLSMLFQWAFFGVRPRWLSAVTGGLRWRWMARAAVLVVPIFVVYVTLSYLLVPSVNQLGSLSADAAVMLAIVVLTTPLQAAGEEYGFRGLIARATGSWFAGPVVALVVSLLISNVVFMLAHLATDPWLIAYYFVFGAALGLIAWRTGGLEVSILVHVANNVFLMIPMALYGDLSKAFERGPGAGGPIMIVPMVIMIALVGVMSWWASRNGVVRTFVPEAVLSETPAATVSSDKIEA